jgi:hypothetical protein
VLEYVNIEIAANDPANKISTRETTTNSAVTPWPCNVSLARRISFNIIKDPYV